MMTEVLRQSARLPLLGTPSPPVVGIIADAGSMNNRFTLGGQHDDQVKAFGAVVADGTVTEPGTRRLECWVPT
jgi:hypothetical protein